MSELPVSELSGTYVHISELVKDSGVYDSQVGDALVFERWLVLPNSSIVKYTFEDTQFIDVWVCDDGLVAWDDSEEPTHRYNFEDDTEYHIISELMDKVPSHA